MQEYSFFLLIGKVFIKREVWPYTKLCGKIRIPHTVTYKEGKKPNNEIKHNGDRKGGVKQDHQGHKH